MTTRARQLATSAATPLAHGDGGGTREDALSYSPVSYMHAGCGENFRSGAALLSRVAKFDVRAAAIFRQ